jgi:hypothetical protein
VIFPVSFSSSKSGIELASTLLRSRENKGRYGVKADARADAAHARARFGQLSAARPARTVADGGARVGAAQLELGQRRVNRRGVGMGGRWAGFGPGWVDAKALAGPRGKN